MSGACAAKLGSEHVRVRTVRSVGYRFDNA